MNSPNLTSRSFHIRYNNKQTRIFGGFKLSEARFSYLSLFAKEIVKFDDFIRGVGEAALHRGYEKIYKQDPRNRLVERKTLSRG